MILAGTTDEMMRSLYSRPHRSSIYEPATIHDIPQEVLEKSLIILLPSIKDLFAASEACRAWRPVAQKLIHSRVKIGHRNRKRVEDMICGYILNSLVFGSSSIQISTLSLELDYIGKEYIPLIAQIVAPNLTSLDLVFNGDEDVSACYETFEIFFSQCQWIRNLRLADGGFRDDADSITPTIKEGFIRLNQFDLINWYGNLRLFIENTPILNLKSFRFESNDTSPDEDFDIVDAAVSNYGQSFINLKLNNCFVSSANLVKIAECCPKLEKFTLLNTEEDGLSLSDFRIIASLPHLSQLEIYCEIDDEAVSYMTRCRGLNYLGIRWRDGLIDVFRVIGGNLVSLDLWEMSVEAIDVIVEYCPNLQYLELNLRVENEDDDVRETVEQKLKVGLKRLAKLDFDGVSASLGTDWQGY
jgi:hypothetical protein